MDIVNLIVVRRYVIIYILLFEIRFVYIVCMYILFISHADIYIMIVCFYSSLQNISASGISSNGQSTTMRSYHQG